MPGGLDVLVLGDVNPDLVLRGENVAPAFGQAERLLDEAHLTVGGSGAILACGAARLGLTVGICGVVGDDLFGRYLREELTRRGVDVRGVVTDPERPTGLTVVLSQPDDRGMLTVPGTIGTLTAASIDPELLASASHVHVSSYFLQTALRPDLPAIFDRVHEVGGTTSIDPNWDPSDTWDGGLLDVLAKTDIFLPNAIEAARIARTHPTWRPPCGASRCARRPRGREAGPARRDRRRVRRDGAGSRDDHDGARHDRRRATRSTRGSWPRGWARPRWSTRSRSRTSAGRCRRAQPAASTAR